MPKHNLILREVDLNVTDRCNLGCEFCSVEILPVSSKSKELDLKQIKELFQEFDSLGVEAVRIVGGEPFVRRDIGDILELASRFTFRTSVLTNGTVITEDHIDLIKRCGISRVSFSVDGHTAELHDKSRGQPRSFERLLKAIHHCRAKKVQHRMMTAVTAAVTPYLKEMVLFAEQHEFELINFILLGLNGLAIGHREHFPTYEKWSNAVVRLTLFIHHDKPNVKVSLLFPHEDEVPVELYSPLKEAGCLSLLKEVWDINLSSSSRNRLHGYSICKAAYDNVSILPNGDVYGCDLMRDIPEFKGGNIFHRSLTDIFYNSPVFKKLRAKPKFRATAHFDAGSTNFSCGQCRAGCRNEMMFPLPILRNSGLSARNCEH